MAHFALSDLQDQRFYFFEKLNREGPGIAGAVTDTLNTWNENWSVKFDGAGMHLQARSSEIEIRFDLAPEKPPAIHGEGISQKAEGAGHASHYYSMTRLKTTGTVIFRGVPYTVSGNSWMDHEFGTNQLAPDQVGWDWFGLQLDDGSDLMLYRMRKRDGSVDRNSSGTLVGQDRRIIHLNVESFQAVSSAQWRSPKTRVTYPLEWAITVPSEGLDLQVTPLMKDQELITTRSTGIAYWEGAVRVSGTHHGQPISGRGYLELTGYDARFRPKV
jgi:predicted secreted hydrolase